MARTNADGTARILDRSEGIRQRTLGARRRDDIDDVIVQRACGEFLEMPGLRLTGKQAQRLWGLDEQSCLELLEFLVEAKFLCRRNDMYSRLTEGRVSPPARMAKAGLGDLRIR
jgi:hypothetical protein